MHTGAIEFPLNVKEFAPGDTVEGIARWSIGKKAEQGLLNLFWYVEQRDGPHIFPVQSLAIAHVSESAEFSFSLDLPEGPFSYKGSLFEVQWAIELLIEPGILDVREKIVLAPDRKPLSF
jgi:hypothetical protein